MAGPMRWDVSNLGPRAVGVSASRRTDIPAVFGAWFERRLREGFVEAVPAGPPRRIRRSLRLEDVTHFNFWSKWPRPFFRVLDTVLDVGVPVLWNVTVTGLGGSAVEPHVPAPDRVVRSIRDLARRVSPAAILWRYDPVFISSRFDARFHLTTFRSLAARLSGSVDRVAISFVTEYGRRVRPDLRAYERESGDTVRRLAAPQAAELACRLREIAAQHGLTLTLCCAPAVRALVGAPRAHCNGWAWATRVYPELGRLRPLRDRPCRPDCGCSDEVDIGAYDTCVLGCRYSYGSASLARARANRARHDPAHPCLLAAPGSESVAGA